MELGYYRHYKGTLYLVGGIARHSETLEPLVIYSSTESLDVLWARPMDMFLESVTLEDGSSTPRFTFLGTACQMMSEP